MMDARSATADSQAMWIWPDAPATKVAVRFGGWVGVA